MGIFAPIITDATSAFDKYTRDLYKILPLSIWGTIKPSTLPDIFESIFLIMDAFLLIAASNAIGPSISRSGFFFFN